MKDDLKDSELDLMQFFERFAEGKKEPFDISRKDFLTATKYKGIECIDTLKSLKEKEYLYIPKPISLDIVYTIQITEKWFNRGK